MIVASRALKEKKENAVTLVFRDLMESKVIQVCKVVLGSKVCVVKLGKRVRRVMTVFQGK